MNVAIVDSGVANLASVLAALKRLDADAEVTNDAQKIRIASHVIIPGVGAASAAMAQLNTKNLVGAIRGLTQPALGICLGMQMLFSRSEEGTGVDCLGVINGVVKKLVPENLPIPHMGWNQLRIQQEKHPLMTGVTKDSFVYFVHSYAAPVGDYSIATCDYDQPFTAIAAHKNFFGCQFHPERSGSVGSQILKNFLEL